MPEIKRGKLRIWFIDFHGLNILPDLNLLFYPLLHRNPSTRNRTRREPDPQTPKPEIIDPDPRTPKPEIIDPDPRTPKPEIIEPDPRTPKPEIIDSSPRTPKPEIIDPGPRTPKPEIPLKLIETTLSYGEIPLKHVLRTD